MLAIVWQAVIFLLLGGLVVSVGWLLADQGGGC